MYCKNCGNEIKNGEKFCCNCGTPIDGGTEIKSHKKSRKIATCLIGICAVGLCVGIGSFVMGNADDLPLLEQIEKKYGIDVPGIEAAGGSAVDNVVLEDYLPYEGYQRNTTMVNSTDGTENLYEEMTMYVEDGKSKYSIYNYLIESITYGEMILADSGEYYYTQQESWWNASDSDMGVYIGLPEKVWTKQNGSDEIKTFIAPEFYTVTTPYGVYENCLLKYEHTSTENSSLKGSNTFTAYAPYGVGKIYSVTYAEDSQEVPLTYYTYIPEDSYSELDNDRESTIAVLSPEIQNILDTSSQYSSDSGLILAMSNGTTNLWVINPSYNTIIYHGTLGTHKYRDGWPVNGDSNMGCGDEILNVFDLENGQFQATLTLWDDIYYFTKDKDSVETDTAQNAPDDGMIIADIMDDETADLWTSGSGTSVLTFAMRLEGEDMHAYLFSVHAMEILYSGVIGTTEDEIYIVGDSGYGSGGIVYLSDNELELTVDSEVYVFTRL